MDSRVEKAISKKSGGQYNCAQAVACTYADLTSFDEDAIARMTAAFGTGMGSMDGTCGALVGAGVIIGLVDGDRVRSRAAMKEIIDKFKHANGATICRELKGIASGRCLRECNDCVADAARLLENYLASKS
ncbi:MAG: C-GCAxxG-C-C family protein [Paramuribaculum sp.]|nr:C-GCAxxG-C-C family protein [Paramuribaculum sp.]